MHLNSFPFPNVENAILVLSQTFRISFANIPRLRSTSNPRHTWQNRALLSSPRPSRSLNRQNFTRSLETLSAPGFFFVSSCSGEWREWRRREQVTPRQERVAQNCNCAAQSARVKRVVIAKTPYKCPLPPVVQISRGGRACYTE